MLETVQHASFITLFSWLDVSTSRKPSRAPLSMMVCVCVWFPETMLPTVRIAGLSTLEGPLCVQIEWPMSKELDFEIPSRKALVIPDRTRAAERTPKKKECEAGCVIQVGV